VISRAAKRGSLRRLGLLALVLASLGLAPTAALAALPSVTATSVSSSPLPQLPPPLDEVERRQEASASRGAFCVEPLELALDGRLGSGKASVDTQDAWGVFRNPDEMNGPLASKNRFAFTGYVFDRETELYFAKARFYDPTVGRFTSQDSFLGDIDQPPSLHRYFYAHANPVRYVDPTGHCVALPGICEAAVSRFVASTRNVNFAGNASGSVPGKLLNFGLHAGIEAVGNAATLPQKVVLGLGDAVTPGGFSYWGGNQVDTSYAPARAQQVAALDAAADPSRSFAERGVYGALSVLSTPVTVVESLTTAPGGRAGDSLGKRLHQAETATSFEDLNFATLEAMGDTVAAFNSFGALAAPFAPKLAAGSTALEGAAQVPASGSTQLRILNPHFTPDPTKVLQNITTTHADVLAANPALAQTVLSPAEYAAGQTSTRVAVLNYGKAAERLPAQEIAQTPLHRQLFDYVGGPNQPDFTGVPGGPAAGMNFDITTPGQIAAHLARPGYGPGLNVVTYQRPVPFKLFP
jgi:RHS repeat-associated protein